MSNRHISALKYICHLNIIVFLRGGGGEVQCFFVLYLKETKRKIVDHSKQFVAICLFETFACPQILRDLILVLSDINSLITNWSSIYTFSTVIHHCFTKLKQHFAAYFYSNCYLYFMKRKFHYLHKGFVRHTQTLMV